MGTMDRVKVTIDLGRVAMNLRTSGGGSADEGTAKSFLRYAGFNPGEDGTWVGPRSGLQRLNHSEVVRVEPSS